MKGVFITGTDTGVGKTRLTALLTRSLRQKHLPAIALKPVACGDRADATEFSEAMGGALPLAEINPIHFASPLAPYTAAVLENRPFPWDLLLSHWREMSSTRPGPFLVEGVGGWRVPLDSKRTVREWARELGLPVLVVCRAGLGTLNHTLLTVDSIRASGLEVPGIVMNFHRAPEDEAVRTNPGILEQLLRLPVAKLDDGASRWEIPGWLSGLLA